VSTSTSMISVREIDKFFDTRNETVRALENINLEIESNQFVSIVGPSGCGKSTLMLLVAGLTQVTNGELLVNNQKVTSPIKDVGIVFQRDVLLEWRTVLSNVLLPLEIKGTKDKKGKDRAMELLHSVGLEGFENKYPGELSGGMRQRVSICRALVHNPSLLLMDEPLGALDAITRDQMCLDLLKIWEDTKKTVLFITHSISEAVFLSDRVLVMSPRPGKIVADIKLDLPRPRDLNMMDSPEFVSYSKQIRHIFEETGIYSRR
jgi:NitT/TauT family transport system ATP-binding protein